MPFELRIAVPADAEEIAALVNGAYRPSPQHAGWTHESNLIDGERITVAQVLHEFESDNTILVLCLEARIVACALVIKAPFGAYIGMLATDPSLQNLGLGKQMLGHAERHAVESYGASLIKMSVLSSRPELLAFYERRGYVLTGEVEEYPLSAGVGRPMIADIQVLSLAKHT